MSIAMLNVLLTEVRLITAERLATFNWIDYTASVASILLAGMIALKTFRSESVAYHRREMLLKKAKASGDSVVSTEVTIKSTEKETVVTDAEIQKEKNHEHIIHSDAGAGTDVGKR